MKPTAAHRQIALAAVAGFGLAIWVFPVIWGVLTSFKTERDVLAYPPVWLFKPTLDSYREVLFGASSILPNIWSSCVVSLSATVLTMLFAVPASYALARLRYPAKRGVWLLRAGHADAAAGRADHSLLPDAAEDRLARHLHRPHRHLPHVLAAVRRSG